MNKVSYFKLVTDSVLLVACFFAASWLSGRTLQRVDGVVLAILGGGWYFSTRITNMYDDFRTEKYVGELLLSLENI